MVPKPFSANAMRCGRFVLEDRIGLGGMGEIFVARDPARGERVAVKRLLPQCAQDPVFVGMFQDELRLAQLMTHPNVCEVYEHGQEDGHYFLAMEYIEGLTLAELIERRGMSGLPFPLACRILAEIASALDYAHRLTDGMGIPLGAVHRDVSPANVMIGRDGRVKLVDFGLAKARTQLVKTQPGLVKGKYGYLAPEQLVGTVDFRTDLFALGLCLYEALTGAQYFDQRTAGETVAAIRAHRAPPKLSGMIEGVPPALDALLAKALARDPDDRFESAAAFRAALGEIVRSAGHAAVTAQTLAQEIARYRPETSSIEPIVRFPRLDALSDPPPPSKGRFVSIALIAGAVAILIAAGALALSFLT